MKFLVSALFREGYGRTRQILSNAPLRIPQMKESSVLEVVTKVAKQQTP
jgi:hypothetical protein